MTAVLTLALGIGGNAAIFTLVNAILLKNLPVVDPSTLIHIGNTTECCVNYGTAEDSGAGDDGSYALFATDTWQQLQKNAPEFEELAAMQSGFGTIIARPDKALEARSVTGEFVSGNYFRTFGLQTSMGRLFTDADNVIGAPLVAVMSYDTWQNNYGSDLSVVGSTFWINTKAVTITGIAPKGFYGDRLSSAPPDFYLPIESIPVLTNATFVHEPGMRWLYIIGRLKPGVAMAPLQAKMTELVRQSLAPTTPFSGERGKRALAKAHVVLSPGGAGIQDMQDSYASKLKLLMWISGLVLLIACGNIANLLLVRGINRREEMSVRTALGARRTRIVRQLLTESIVLSIISGMAGLIVAYAGTRMLLAMAFPGAQNVPIDASPSGVVLAFAFGISLLTGILFGVAPAWITSNANPADALRSGGYHHIRSLTPAAQPHRAAVGSRPGAAGRSRHVYPKPEQAQEHRSQAQPDEPIHRPFQPAGHGLLPRPGGSPLSDHRRAVPHYPRRQKVRILDQHPNGGQQLGRWRPEFREASPS